VSKTVPETPTHGKANEYKHKKLRVDKAEKIGKISEAREGAYHEIHTNVGEWNHMNIKRAVSIGSVGSEKRRRHTHCQQGNQRRSVPPHL
jgi:hypothetical protein